MTQIIAAAEIIKLGVVQSEVLETNGFVEVALVAGLTKFKTQE